jgi:hypothetical protein
MLATIMSRDANNVLLGGGVRARVRVRVQRKFKGKTKGTAKPFDGIAGLVALTILLLERSRESVGLLASLPKYSLPFQRCCIGNSL